MNTIPPNGSPLLTRLAIDHGPADLLDRFFRHADAAARVLGVTLSFADLAELIATAMARWWRPMRVGIST